MHYNKSRYTIPLYGSASFVEPEPFEKKTFPFFPPVRYFPLFFDTTRKTILVAGGGEVALQKVRLLLKSEARIVVMATTLCSELQSCLKENKIEHTLCVYDETLAQEAHLVFAATPCAGINGLFIKAKAGATVNVVDKPALGNVIMPALVDRDPVVVAVGSDGASPVLAMSIKSRIEQLLEHDIGTFAKLCAALRTKVARYIPRPERRSFWQWAINGTPRNLWRQQQYNSAKQLLENTILDRKTFYHARPLVSIIMVCHKVDMMAVRAVQRLQNADVIFHDQPISKETFEFARRDAPRIAVADSFLEEKFDPSHKNIVYMTQKKLSCLENMLESLSTQSQGAEIIPCSCKNKVIQKIAND